jgi:hypothetical protein
MIAIIAAINIGDANKAYRLLDCRSFATISGAPGLCTIEGAATSAANWYPRPGIVRMTCFVLSSSAVRTSLMQRERDSSEAITLGQTASIISSFATNVPALQTR